MIGRLFGRVLAQEDENAVVLDVGGVGYELTVPLGTTGRVSHDDQGRQVFFVHTHVREDAFTLFGFASDYERRAFRVLIGISSIGPKTAISILGSISINDLATAVGRKDVGTLTRIPGIGKKTAERLVLELQGKLDVSTASSGVVSSTRTGNDMLLQGALVSMGYKPAEADRAVQSLGPRIHELGLPELIREALGLLTR